MVDWDEMKYEALLLGSIFEFGFFNLEEKQINPLIYI